MLGQYEDWNWKKTHFYLNAILELQYNLPAV